MLTVCTGWHPEGYEQYGWLFLLCWERFWPKDVPLKIYVEAEHPVPTSHNIELVNLNKVHGNECRCLYDSPVGRGKEARPNWKDKERHAGYSYRTDAFKFYKQGIIPWDAAWRIKEGHLLWLDGDVETIRPVTAEWVTGLLPPDKDLAYLGREPKHSEIGFQLYRLPEARSVLAGFSNLYFSGEILKYPEWHSAYAFDIARKASEAVGMVRSHNLTPGGSGHVWLSSPLSTRLVHHKGARKADWARRDGWRRP